MPRYVALLRGVNVGGRNKVPMAELRLLVESLGCTGVATVIQSGNVVFTARRPVRSERLQDAIAGRFGVRTPVILRTASEVVAVAEHPLFPDLDPATVHVGFLAESPTVEAATAVETTAAAVEGASFGTERFALDGTEVYLHLPGGMARARLPSHLERHLGVPLTIRNWATVTKLADLAGR